MPYDATKKAPKLQLAWNLPVSSLYDRSGLNQIDTLFSDFIRQVDPDLSQVYAAFVADPDACSAEAYDELIMAVSPILAHFILTLFGIDQDDAVDSATDITKIMAFRHVCVLPAQRRGYAPQSALPSAQVCHQWLCEAVGQTEPSEAVVATFVQEAELTQDQEVLRRVQDWCFYVVTGVLPDTLTQSWYSFWVPKRLGEWLVEVRQGEHDCHVQSSQMQPYQREDFRLVDTAMTPEAIALQSDYCKICHPKGVDYCRSGFYQNKKDPNQGFKTSREGEVLSGCPLDEKISPMHAFMNQGMPLAAWIAVMIDNPMCPATGHKICNDCIQSCIYQKQEGVDTPQVETHVLMQVLALPWGVEIYDLLVKWHPLRRTERLPLAPSGNRVLVMGLGPSGFSLMHHLWMRGVTVLGADGANLLDWPFGDVTTPIYDYQTLWEDLSERRSLGFGGVAEYGITVRWDKNFLKLIYLSLLRRPRLAMVGNVRFGGNLCVEDAWHYGFDHVALALGAGLPQALSIPHSLAPGMSQANDFLMSLQLTGAQHHSSLIKLTMHMPCLVIGAGLTAVDAATEAKTYYCQMVTMVYLRVDALQKKRGETALWASFSPGERAQIMLWHSHGHALLQHKKQAHARGEVVDYSDLLESWGGVSMVYRRRLDQAPSYRQNASELQAALDQGIHFIAETTPLALDLDPEGSVAGLHVLQPWRQEDSAGEALIWQVEDYSSGVIHARIQSGSAVAGMVFQGSNKQADFTLQVVSVAPQDQLVVACFHPQVSPRGTAFSPGDKLVLQGPYRAALLPAKQILVATGAKPNTAYAYEHRDSFQRQGAYYALHRWDATQSRLVLVSEFDAGQKQADAFFTSYYQAGKTVSAVGDLHPHYHGSVVKAIASSAHAVSPIMEVLPDRGRGEASALASQEQAFAATMRQFFSARVVAKRRLSSKRILLDVAAPHVIHKALPGHFFKLSRLPAFVPQVPEGTAEVDAGAYQMIGCDKERYLIRFMLLERQIQDAVLSGVEEGEAIACMGPTGVRLKTDYPEPQVQWFLADGVGLGQSLYYAYELKQAGHMVKVWVHTPTVEPDFDLDVYAEEWDVPIGFYEGDLPVFTKEDEVVSLHRLYLQGGADFVKRSYQSWQRRYGKVVRVGFSCVGSVHGPMQCMLKGICAQCLQWQIDPQTGERTKAVYSCSWQDQPLEIVDLDHMISRTRSHQSLEKLNKQWLGFVDRGETVE